MSTIGNEFAVGALGDDIVILKPRNKMSKKEALNLAGWLVALSTYNPEKDFMPLLNEIYS